jgi:hypothetical protein
MAQTFDHFHVTDLVLLVLIRLRYSINLTVKIVKKITWILFLQHQGEKREDKKMRR